MIYIKYKEITNEQKHSEEMKEEIEKAMKDISKYLGEVGIPKLETF